MIGRSDLVASVLGGERDIFLKCTWINCLETPHRSSIILRGHCREAPDTIHEPLAQYTRVPIFVVTIV